jgi:hypothetical protein
MDDSYVVCRKSSANVQNVALGDTNRLGKKKREYSRVQVSI